MFTLDSLIYIPLKDQFRGSNLKLKILFVSTDTVLFLTFSFIKVPKEEVIY
jgi:hypothetical protein